MMRTLTLVAMSLVAAAACADGAELFGNFCRSCHGDNPEPVQAFAESRERFQLILEGDTEGMPDFFGVFTNEEIDALYDYVTAFDGGVTGED